MALPTWALLTLEEVKQHLRIETDAEDALLERLITAAIREAERYTGRMFVQREVTDTFTGEDAVNRGSVLRLHWRPVALVSSVAIDGQEITDYGLNLPYARLIRSGSWPADSTITVTYTAGYKPTAAEAAAEVPEVVQGCLLAIAHWYENRVDRTGRQLVVGLGDVMYTAPSEALRLWDLYRVPPGV